MYISTYTQNKTLQTKGHLIDVAVKVHSPECFCPRFSSHIQQFESLRAELHLQLFPLVQIHPGIAVHSFPPGFLFAGHCLQSSDDGLWMEAVFLTQCPYFMAQELAAAHLLLLAAAIHVLYGTVGHLQVDDIESVLWYEQASFAGVVIHVELSSLLFPAENSFFIQ